LVHSKVNHLVILIENKIRSKESKGQLLKYMGIVRRSFPDTKITIPVLLTLEGDDPSEVAQELGYISWSHVAVYKVATEVIEQHQHRIPQDAQTFLRHYLDTLRRETMQDKELEDLCKSIYRKHKAAIDLIVKYGATTVFGEATEDFLNGHPDMEPTKTTATQLWFVPKEWASEMPKEIEGWPSPYPVTLWFYLEQQVQKIGIVLEIGPLAGIERRRRLVEAFRQSGFSVPTRADREKAKYSRVYSATHIIRDLGDSEEVKQAIGTLWQQSKDEVIKATKVVKNFGWQK
jgi:hypothetical protein